MITYLAFIPHARGRNANCTPTVEVQRVHPTRARPKWESHMQHVLSAGSSHTREAEI